LSVTKYIVSKNKEKEQRFIILRIELLYSPPIVFLIRGIKMNDTIGVRIIKYLKVVQLIFEFASDNLFKVIPADQIQPKYVNIIEKAAKNAAVIFKSNPVCFSIKTLVIIDKIGMRVISEKIFQLCDFNNFILSFVVNQIIY
jgi:hypothetical protein